MPKLPRFLATPVWKQVRRGYGTLTSPSSRKFFATPLVRLSLRVTGATLLIYILVIGSAAIFIYRGSSNFYTRTAERIFSYPAGIVAGESIPLSRFRLEVAARKHYAQVRGAAFTEAEIEDFAMTQLETRKLFSQVLAEKSLMISEEELSNRMNEIISQAGGEDKFRQFLKENYSEKVTIDVFRMWMKEAAIESTIQQKVLVHTELKHILVAVPENASADQVDKALTKIRDIRNSITDIASFAEVARQRSEDVASRDKGGDFGTTNKGSDAPVLSADFEKAAFETAVGQISEPVRTPNGWHILYIVSRGGDTNLSKKQLLEERRQAAGIRRFVATN
jgi:hypothetical protein